jgi:hypothetical protein
VAVVESLVGALVQKTEPNTARYDFAPMEHSNPGLNRIYGC